MKHKKKGSTGRFLSILLAAVMALSLLTADILSPAVYAEETGYDEAAGGAETEKTASAKEDGNAVPAEESGAGEDDTGEPETEAGSTEEPENGDGSIEEPDDGEEPGEEPAGTEKEDTAECVCGTLCTADSVNGDCPVCGAEGAGIAGCKGEPEDAKDPEQEDTKKEDTEQEDTEEENTEQEDTQDTGLCGHHPEHTADCGYSEEDNTPCTYECRICPIEDLIAALPDEVTADNAENVRAQLDEILALYRELTEDEQDQIDLSRCYALQEALDKANAPEPLAGDVSANYREAHWDESSQTVVYEDKTEDTCTAVTEDTATWDAGWYVVNSTVTIDGRITVTGAVNLILEDGCALTASQGITVSSGNSLTIYGQTGGTGKLTATGAANCAGIGGIDSTGVRNSGAITICGGMVTAAGGEYCAGIGGGGKLSMGGAGSGITIYGGTVEATGGTDGAGIGGSRLGEGSNIIIYGGTVEATGGARGAGIGGGFRGNGSGITIYGGTVTAKGGEGDASGAGIGGGGGSGMTSGGTGSNIKISGGTVKATGGSSGAGIGGGYLNAGSGITISGGTVEATSGTYGAGIGGGSKGAGSNITISGGEVEATSGTYGAGIGGGNQGAGSNITISGGEVTAKGGYDGAGIGGGYYGNGSDITISGGKVTATGDSGGAGIGGGGTGAGNDITISGGTVTATSDGSGKGIGGGNNGGTSTGFFTGDDGSAVIFASSIGDPSGAENWNGVFFQGDEGTVYGDVTLTEDFEIPGGKTLTISDGSSLTIPDGKTLTIPAGASVTNEGDLAIAGGELSGGGILTGDGAFTEDLTADMIVVSTGRYYTPGLTETELAGKISISGGSKTILGQTFTVDPSDWTLSVTKESDLEYTATYTNNSDPNKTVSKTITFLQSGTEFAGSGAVKTYKGETETSTFAYSDTITVRATPTATGKAPAANGAAAAAARSASLMAAGFDKPAAGRMAVYYKGVQVSAPSTVTDGVHTMTVDPADLGLTEQELNGEITLTARYIASSTMAGAESTIKVTVTAAAKVEKSGATTYVGGLQDAFVALNSGATITMLDNVTISSMVTVSSGTFTLDLSGKTLTLPSGDTASPDALLAVQGGTLTIIDSPGGGKVTSEKTAGLKLAGGVLYLKGGSFAGSQAGVQCKSGTLYVSGDAMLGDADTSVGLDIDPISSLTVQLYGGIYSGRYVAGLTGAIRIASSADMTLGDLLAENHAFYEDEAPILDSLDKTLLSGSVEVKSCTHEGASGYTSNDNGTHTLTCRACGYTEAAKECTYDFEGDAGICQDCRSMLTVSLTGTDGLVYDGSEKKPGVTVTVNGKELTENADYTVISYQNNINAGDAAKLTVGGMGSYRFNITKNFTILPADLSGAGVTADDCIYTGNPLTPAVNVKLDGRTLTKDTDYTVSYENNINAGEDTATVTVAGQGNYTGTATARFSIRYYDKDNVPVKFNGGELTDWYAGTVTVTAAGFTIADSLNGSYQSDYLIKEGGKYTLYFKQDATGYRTDGIPYTINIDNTPPTGRIKLNYKWWENLLSAVSFGHYKAAGKTVTITAEDSGSGVESIRYAIVTGEDQYTTVDALKAANLSWTDYSSGSDRPTVAADTRTVIYAEITDKVGNVAYISTEGILLDETAPAISDLEVVPDTVTDTGAQISLTVNEAATVYLVAVKKEEAGVYSPADVIATCDSGAAGAAGGTPVSKAAWSGTLTVAEAQSGVKLSKAATGLAPFTEYQIFAVAVDKVIDMDQTTDEAHPVYTGNVSEINSGLSFRTKKTLPVITKNPAVSGTYGQRVGEMTVTGGTAQNGNTVLTGTWTVIAADQDKKPSAGTKEEVTVIFTPDSDSYDSVSVKVIPTVSPRSLSAPGVAISDVAGTYTYTGSEIKPPVAVTGTPAAGISISDSGAILTANDLMVSYSNNMNAGTASVTITGTGNYTGQVTRTFTIGKAPGRTIGSLSGTPVVDDKNQTYTYTITPIEGAVYRMGDSGWTGPEQKNGNVFTGIKPGTTVMFYAKMPGTPNYEEGEAKSITVDFPKLTPAAPVLSYTRETDADGNITLIIKEVTGAEYSFDGGQTWTDSNIKDGLDRSQTVTLAIRLKETDTHDPSPAQTVTVSLAKEDRGAPPAFTLSVEANGETDYTVTIPPTGGCEYSFDGKTWSDDHVKTGVKVGETVTGYMRYKETDKYNTGSAASAKATMPKFTVKTPVISPAGGSYSGSVSVTITCGSPDAEIYYTTDGSMPGRSSTRYTGAFTVSVPATVRAVAMKDGLNDSAAASETYTKKAGGSGSSGGSGSGGSGSSGGSESDDSGDGNGGQNIGDGKTLSAIPIIPPAENITDPGQGTGPVKPGTGTTERLGTGAAPGSGSTGETRPGQGIPFIKGEDGKIGWDVIRTEEEQAGEGSIINVDMNGSIVVPGDIFDSIKGRDITITFDMGNGIIWSVDGKSVTTDKAGDIDLSVKTGTDAVPVDIINNVTGERYSIQISLAYDGEFGFTAVLFLNLGKENAGYTASLYHYNESTGELEFICADTVAEDGTVSFAFTHASDYVIAIDGNEEEESGTRETAQPPSAGTDESAGNVSESPEAGQAGKLWWIIVAVLLAAAIGTGAVLAVKKKAVFDKKIL